MHPLQELLVAIANVGGKQKPLERLGEGLVLKQAVMAGLGHAAGVGKAT
ncbi:hypothetical protein [Phormidium tenue]|nr:hypothetical protein [Phormidium tenue]